MRAEGISGTAIPHTRGIPLPLPRDSRDEDHITARVSRPAVTGRGWWRQPSTEEFTPEQLAAAGYRATGTGSAKPVKRRAPARVAGDRAAHPQAVTAAERDQIVQAYRGGATIAEVVRTVGRSRPTVQRVLDDAHVTRDPTRRRPAAPRGDEVTVDIVRLYSVELQTVEAIARTLRVGAATVRNVLDDQGIARRDDRATRGRRTTPAVEEAIVATYAELGNVVAVARRLHVSDKTIRRTLLERGVRIANAAQVQAGRPGTNNAAQLADLMAAHHVTAADVRSWAAQTGRDCPSRGIPPRSLVEAYILLRPLTAHTA